MLPDAEPGYFARSPGFVIFRYKNKLLADRYFVRNMDKIVDINSSGLRLIAQRLYNIRDPVAKANLINQMILEFRQMLE